MREPRHVPRTALTREEAAYSLGVGLTTFKTEIQPQLKIIRIGKVRLIPLAELERWTSENAQSVVVD